MKLLQLASLLTLLLFLHGCRKKEEKDEAGKKGESEFFTTPPKKVSELSSNRLAKEPTHFLRSQVSSPIHWQPWTTEVTDLAERSQKLILVFVGSSSHPLSYTTAKLLDQKFAAEINEQYVPVLADIKVDPSLALACHQLARERQESIAFPYLIWMSHEGNPVAWLPINQQEEDDFLLGFRRAQNTVETIKEKSARYVVENSRYDNEKRIARINDFLSLEGITDEQKKEPSQARLFLSAGGLSDFYDPIELSFDGTGGIPPGNLITTLGRIGQHPACPPRVKKNITQATRDSVKNLAQSAIFDPLDHFFFSRRNSRSFAIPALSKNLDTQSEMLSAMASSPSTPASRWASQQMLVELEKEPFMATSVLPLEHNEHAFFWSLKALADILTEDELKVATAAFNLKKLGNIPSNDDTKRIYFRRNTLGQVRVGRELASATGLSQSQSDALLASAITKIKSRRDEILETGDSEYKETSAVLGSRARLLTALCRSYAADPRETTLSYLNSVGEDLLTRFCKEDGSLLRIPKEENTRSAPAFGYDYAVTIEALLEWHRLTWNPKRLQEARELTTLLLDNYTTDDNFLIETTSGESPLTFPVADTSMVFGPSTWGISYGVLNRMKNIGYEHPKLEPTLAAISAPLQLGLEEIPVTHTDYLAAAINNLDGYVLLVSAKIRENQKLRMALAEAPFDSVFVVVEDPTLATLPSVGNKAALLLKKGEVAQSFSSADGILGGLRTALKN